ncbi:MAG: hypothetical protein JKY90_01750 [Gammaproteobacteria bacterium]|nr:hypothetical protein [Gammaproteobacteria bacterium]
MTLVVDGTIKQLDQFMEHDLAIEISQLFVIPQELAHTFAEPAPHVKHGAGRA